MTKTILVTGASSGIGKATALLFQSQGWNVIATMRKPEAGGDLAKLPNVLVTRLDVTDGASITAAIDAGVTRFGGLDAVLNNAGYGAYGPLEAFDMEGIRRQFDTNVIGLLEVTKTALPHLRTRGAGTIVNISSIGGQMTFPLGTLYHGTKFAVEGLSEALSYELAPLGIAVKIVQPGMIVTDFGGRSFDFRFDPALDDYAPTVGKMQEGMAHFMEQGGSAPELVAEVILKAVNDPSNRLRYRAGPDAETLLDARKAQDDATFTAGIRAQFGL